MMKKILKKKKLIKSSHDSGFGIFGPWRFTFSAHMSDFFWSSNHTTTNNKSHASLRINIINNTLYNYVVLINNVYINLYLNVEHTTNIIVRIRVKMYWVLYY